MNMAKTKYNSTEDLIDKLKQLKFYKNIIHYYNEMKHNFQTHQQDTFAKSAQGISKIYHEVLLLMKFLQTKPQVGNNNIKYYDLYYTVIRIRDEDKDIDNQYEDDDNDYNNFNDFITPNHYIGIKPRETILK